MRNDPVIDEVRKARQDILAECGGDLDKLAERLRTQRADYAGRLVTLEDVRRLKAAAAKPVADRSN